MVYFKLLNNKLVLYKAYLAALTSFTEYRTCNYTATKIVPYIELHCLPCLYPLSTYIN